MDTGLELNDEDARVVSAFMARVAALPGRGPLSDPMPIWWKARLLQHWAAARRVQAPLDVMERVELIAGLAVAGVLLAWAAPTVVHVLAEPLRLLPLG